MTATETPAKIPVVTLSKVKYAEFSSEETNCFSATVLVDGVEIGNVANAGRGGCDDFWPLAVEGKLTEIAKQMPPLYPKEKWENSAELLVSVLFEGWLASRNLKKEMKRNLVFTKADGSVFSSIFKPADALPKFLALGEDAVKARFPGSVKILNLLPYDEALAAYKEGTTVAR